MSHLIEIELMRLRKNIRMRLNTAAQRIIEEEVLKILGRVKIIRSTSLDPVSYEWIITQEEK